MKNDDGKLVKCRKKTNFEFQVAGFLQVTVQAASEQWAM